MTGTVPALFSHGSYVLTDNFGTDLSGKDVALPVLLLEPQDSFVVRNRPAILKCKAAHSLQVHKIHSFISIFFCVVVVVVVVVARLCTVTEMEHTHARNQIDQSIRSALGKPQTRIIHITFLFVCTVWLCAYLFGFGAGETFI